MNLKGGGIILLLMASGLPSPSTSRDCGTHLTCPDGVTCCHDTTYTCCPMPSAQTGTGCCPYVNAVCCVDGEYCCPEGFICSGKGRCSLLKPANVTDSPINSAPTLVTGFTPVPETSTVEIWN